VVESTPVPLKRDPLEAIRAAFGTADLRRLQFGWAASSVGTWAFMVVLAVYAYDAGGASAVGVAALVRMLPAAFTAPITSLLADRSSRRDVMMWATLVRAGSLALVAAAVAAGAPFAVVLVFAAVFTIASTAIKPAQAALLPTLARTPEQLAASNAAWSGIDNAGFLIGAILGGTLVAGTSAELAFAVTAADFLLAALLIHRIPRDPRPAHRDPLPGARLVREARSGIDTVIAEPRLRLLVSFLAATTFIEGAIDVLVVVAALELLDMGAGGVGWLNAAWGVGGLGGGVIALAVLRRGRIAFGLAAGCIIAGVALGLIASWPRPGAALGLLVVLGVGYAWVEVAGLTLMQRLVSDEVLARVFGVVESTYVASTGLGSILAPVAVVAFGIKGALVAVGACLPLLALLSWTRLARFEATTPIPERQFALLRACSLFAPLPLATVENLAARLVPVAVTPGQEVIRQGDMGDRFYVIAQGHVAVECDGEPRRTEGPGEFFGEIALLRDTPRTATVHATEPGLLYALDREHFVCGVTGNARSAMAADGVIETRLAAVGLDAAVEPAVPGP
jgi:MFS family permease